MGGDAIAMQEVRLTADGVRVATELAEENHFQGFWGKPQALRRQQGTTRMYDAKPGGIGCLLRRGVQAFPSPRTEMGAGSGALEGCPGPQICSKCAPNLLLFSGGRGQPGKEENKEGELEIA